MKDGERLFLMSCCRTKVNAQVIQRDKIELCFLKHHTMSNVPMTAKEIEGLRIAFNVPVF